MICTSMVPCLSSHLAKNNKIMSMFLPGFLGHFESLVFFKNGGTKFTPGERSQTGYF